MLPRPDSAAILFPGALGDFICFLPTVVTLRDRYRGQLLLIARPAALDLVDMPGLAKASIDRREVADLFALGGAVAPATRALLGGFTRVYSWTGWGNADFAARLKAASGGGVDVFAFRGMRPSEHAVDYYARCAGVALQKLSVDCIRQDKEWAAAFWRRQPDGQRRLVLHPGSGSRSKNWQGFIGLAREWRERHDDTIVVLSGPAEASPGLDVELGVIALDGLSLPQVAALLQSCTLYTGNDSGISHLAGAVGARGAVLFGPSDPVLWAPRSDRLTVVHARSPCTTCPAGVFCVHSLPVDVVMQALESAASTVVVARPRVGADGTRRC
jgi:ADP-heptose:LPS heptosyltransferase